jgi:hypothetical protein
MQFVSFKQFVEMPKHGYLFFFSKEESCGLCKQQQTELEKYDIHGLIKISISDEDDFKSIGVMAVPLMRFYDTQEKCAYQRHGVLYDKQMRELMEAFNNQ